MQMYDRIVLYNPGIYITHSAAEVVELLLEQQTRDRGREKLGDTGSWAVRAMRCAEGVIHIPVFVFVCVCVWGWGGN